VLSGSSILITGGTGSFGHTFVPMTLQKYNPRRLMVFRPENSEFIQMLQGEGIPTRNEGSQRA